MSQKVQVYRQYKKKTQTYGKYYVRAVYDDRFITTNELADFIQQQASIKRSDCKAVLDELGAAMKHFFELGQKIKLEGIGIFKVGVSSTGSDTEAGCTAANVSGSHVLFAPETSSMPTGRTAEVTRAGIVGGEPVLLTYQQTTYNHPATMLKDVRFELAKGGYGINTSGGTVSSSATGGSSSSGGNNSGGNSNTDPNTPTEDIPGEDRP
jgi:predicted histone-like DNA-binding protein